MPTLRDVKNRIRSVQSTRRITKAMEMVAANKHYWCVSNVRNTSTVKCLIIAVLIAAVLTGQSSANEGMTFGLRLGVGLSVMSGTPVPNPTDPTFDSGNDLNQQIGYLAGVFVVAPIMNSISLQPELNLNYYRTNADFFRSIRPALFPAKMTEKMKLLYFEIPVLVKFHLTTGKKAALNIFGGPAIAYNISAKDEIKNTALIEFLALVPNPDITNVNKTGVSLIIGGDYQFTIGTYELLIDLRYSHSFEETFHGVAQGDIPSFNGSDSFPDEIPLVSQSGEAPDLKNRAITLSIGLNL